MHKYSQATCSSHMSLMWSTVYIFRDAFKLTAKYCLYFQGCIKAYSLLYTMKKEVHLLEFYRKILYDDPNRATGFNTGVILLFILILYLLQKSPHKTPLHTSQSCLYWMRCTVGSLQRYTYTAWMINTCKVHNVQSMKWSVFESRVTSSQCTYFENDMLWIENTARKCL